MKPVLLILLVCSFSSLDAQNQSWGNTKLRDGDVFYSVEVAPKFPGGMKAYYQFLADSLKMPKNNFYGATNRVGIIRVIIDETGKAAYAEIEKSINDDYDKAIIQMVKLMPKWSPGLQNGHPVATWITLPIVFLD